MGSTRPQVQQAKAAGTQHVCAQVCGISMIRPTAAMLVQRGLCTPGLQGTEGGCLHTGAVDPSDTFVLSLVLTAVKAQLLVVHRRCSMCGTGYLRTDQVYVCS